ncbi:MAG: hypothetical protein HQL37_10390 [Alphaproteobacteria bacterium]|nr:hypothetical protein [Alphaproteobacteria bacterium]
MSEGQQRQSFEQAASEAGNNLLRASVTAGVHPKDPMRPLFASITAVLQLLGRMPSELVQTQKTTEAAAIASLQVALKDQLARLIAENGGELARAEGRRQGQRLLIVAGLVLLAVGGGGYYLGHLSTIEAEHARADAVIAEEHEKYAELNVAVVKLHEWASKVYLPQQIDGGAPYPCVWTTAPWTNPITKKVHSTCSVALGPGT